MPYNGHFTVNRTLNRMLIHPQFDPVALAIGPLKIHWYGLMYLLGFLFFVILGRYRIKQKPEAGFTREMLDDVLFFGVLGVVLGGRLGQVLFYEPDYYFQHPLEIMAIWQGGMSFHGGFLGVGIAMILLARKYHLSWLKVTDFITPLIPPGLGMGRIGNFINGELWGRPADMPWGMVFPYVDNLPRHPSQLYEFALEGVLLFIIVWVYSAKSRPPGAVLGVFMIGYGLFRSFVELFREPDDGFLGLMTWGLSMGQWLSLPMAAVGVMLLFWSHRRSVKK